MKDDEKYGLAVVIFDEPEGERPGKPCTAWALFDDLGALVPSGFSKEEAERKAAEHTQQASGFATYVAKKIDW